MSEQLRETKAVELSAVCETCGSTYEARIPADQWKLEGNEYTTTIRPRCWLCGPSMDRPMAILFPNGFRVEK